MNTEINILQVSVLNNGATILKRKSTEAGYKDIVLAMTADNGFVTWVQNKNDVALGFDGTYHGVYYHDDLNAALKGFEVRS